MNTGVNAKIISSLEKIVPYVEPKTEETSGTTFLGHTYHVQLALQSEKEDFTFPELRVNVEGKLTEYVKIYFEEVVPANTYAPNADDYYIGKEHGVLPDPLLPIGEFGFNLPYMQWRGIWVSFEIPEEIECGEYETAFSVISADGAVVAQLKHSLEIIPIKPQRHDLRTTNWMHYDCISEKHGVKLFGNKFYAVFDKYLETYVKSGFTMLLTPLFTPPLDTAIGRERKTAQLIDVSIVDGKYIFSFAKLKRFMRFALKKGVKYFEFSHLFTQWGGKFTPKIIATVDGEEKRIFGWDVGADDEKYSAFLQAFLPELIAVLREMKVESICYFHLTDEPKVRDLSAYAKCHELVKGLLGDLKTMDALSHSEFYDNGLVDVPVVAIDSYKKRYADKNVGELFIYNCCAPVNEYYSNRFITMPSLRLRILALQIYQANVQGYLHWGFNFYRTRLSYSAIDPYSNTDAGGGYPSGDGFIVYPTENAVAPSVRSMVISQGFMDYECLKLLEQYEGRERVLECLKEYGINGFTEYPRDEANYINLMAKIHALIKEHVAEK